MPNWLPEELFEDVEVLGKTLSLAEKARDEFLKGFKGNPAELATLEKLLARIDAVGKSLDRAKKVQQAWSASLQAGTSAATNAFAAATAASVAFSAAASPVAFDTMTGSFRMLSAAIGQAFIPAIAEVSRQVQAVAEWFDSFSDSQKSAAGQTVLYGGVLIVVSAAIAKMITLVASLRAGFIAMQMSARAALIAGIATPVGAALAAIGALAMMFNHFKANAESSADAVQRLEDFNERRRQGQAIDRRELRNLPDDLRGRVERVGTDRREQRRLADILDREADQIRRQTGGRSADDERALAMRRAQEYNSRWDVDATRSNPSNDWRRHLPNEGYGLLWNRKPKDAASEGDRAAARVESIETRQHLAKALRAGTLPLGQKGMMISQSREMTPQFTAIDQARKALQVGALATGGPEAETLRMQREGNARMAEIARNTAVTASRLPVVR